MDQGTKEEEKPRSPVGLIASLGSIVAQMADGAAFGQAKRAEKEPFEVLRDIQDAVDATKTLLQNGHPAPQRNWRDILHADPVKASELVGLIGMPVPYIIKPIAVRGSLTQIQGIPKSGKSAFAVFVSMCAASDTWPQPELLGPVTPGALKVLYLAWEDPKLMMAQRLSLYGQGLGFTKTFLPDNLTFVFAPDLFVERVDHAEALRAAIAELRPDIVVVDTLSHVHQCDENAASEMKIPMRALDQIARETEISIIYLHHTRKGADGNATEKGRGSQSIAAAWHVLVDWGLRQPGSNVNPVQIQSKYEHEWQHWNVRYCPVRSGEPGHESEVIQVKWEIEKEGAAATAKPEKISKADVKRTRIIEALKELCLAALDGWTTASDVSAASNLGLDTKSIKRHLADLCAEGLVEFKEGTATKAGRTPNTYKLKLGGNLSDL